MREQRKAGIEQGARARAHDEDSAGRKAISQSAQGEAHGSENEAELYCIGEQTDPGNAYTPGAHEIGCRTVGTEPKRCAEQLCHCYSRDWVGAHDFDGPFSLWNTNCKFDVAWTGWIVSRRLHTAERITAGKVEYFIVCLT